MRRCAPLALRTPPVVPQRRALGSQRHTAAPLPPCGTAAEGPAAATAAPAAHATSEARPAPPVSKSRFCRQCGATNEVIRPDGDNEWRHVCTNPSCKHIEYFNPKMVVGCIVEHAGQLLLCRRAIEPCRGKWTVPAGFLELAESTAAGAARETLEETGAKVTITAPFFHLDIPAIGQSYLLFAARLAPPYTFAPTPESLEVRLFSPADIPWADIAFSSVAISLRAYCDDLAAGTHSVHHGVIQKVPGSAPNDANGFRLTDHFALPLAAAPGGGGAA